MTSDACVPRRIPVRDDEPPALQDHRTREIWQSDLESLYRQRADRLIRHFTSSTDGREPASDVVHEAFARFAALSAARRLIVARPDAYLYRMCVNLIRDRGRTQQLQVRCFENQSFSGADRHDPLVQLEQRDELRRLEAAMLRLKPKTREIFLAKRLGGMSYAEIAERTGLSPKGVEKHMSKAIAILERAMGRDRP